MLSGVDNVTVDGGTGDIFVAEDGGNMEIVIITPDGDVAPFLRVVDQKNSEITGPVFNPRRDRLYFSSQRGPSSKAIRDINPAVDSADQFGGVTYEITGPFRGIVEAPPVTEPVDTTPDGPTSLAPETAAPPSVPSPVDTLARVTERSGSDDGTNVALIAGAGGAAVLAGIAGVVALRSRRSG
ncbi:MAG: hypothetical protein R2695_08920 [Acidimicrobiales bacterium]